MHDSFKGHRPKPGSGLEAVKSEDSETPFLHVVRIQEVGMEGLAALPRCAFNRGLRTLELGMTYFRFCSVVVYPSLTLTSQAGPCRSPVKCMECARQMCTNGLGRWAKLPSCKTRRLRLSWAGLLKTAHSWATLEMSACASSIRGSCKRSSRWPAR